ncbi:hypothetical protein [Synechococcus phage Ssp-JY38]|nr:hypothetical protein [Synechococcus phage Yong-L2-223]
MDKPLDAITFANALDAFWNAAIGESHSRQEGAAAAAIMATGFAAVAEQLRQGAKLAGEQSPQQLKGENKLLRERISNLQQELNVAADRLRQADVLGKALADLDSEHAEMTKRAERAEEAFEIAKQEHEKVLAALKEASITLRPMPLVEGAWEYVVELPDGDWPRGTEIYVEHDGFRGRVLNPYVTFEGKKGQVCQHNGSRMVHVYGEKWLKRVAPEVSDAQNDANG